MFEALWSKIQKIHVPNLPCEFGAHSTLLYCSVLRCKPPTSLFLHVPDALSEPSIFQMADGELQHANDPAFVERSCFNQDHRFQQKYDCAHPKSCGIRLCRYVVHIILAWHAGGHWGTLSTPCLIFELAKALSNLFAPRNDLENS